MGKNDPFQFKASVFLVATLDTLHGSFFSTHIHHQNLTSRPNMFFFNKIYLVGGFNPFEKYERQHGNLPQFSG